MAFNLFKKRCPISGEVVDKETAILRFGQYFCSEEHAEEYRKKVAKEQAEGCGGGCC